MRPFLGNAIGENAQKIVVEQRWGIPDTAVGIEADTEAEADTAVGTAVGLDTVVGTAAVAAGIEPEAAAGIEIPVAAALLQRLGVAVEERQRMADAVAAQHFRLSKTENDENKI
jgi:hypothetical protein